MVRFSGIVRTCPGDRFQVINFYHICNFFPAQGRRSQTLEVTQMLYYIIEAL